MASSSKKITYTSDFKLKVLDYYFKNGGDENFGLKKKTAGHFNIDKKTINRMLNNPDMVKRARKLLTKKVTGSTKGAAAARHGGTKATAKGAKASGSKLGTSGGKLGSSGAKLGSSGAKLGSSGTKLSSSGTKLGSSGAKLNSSRPAMSGGKLGSAGTSGRVAGSSYACAANTSSSTLKTPTSSSISTKHMGGSGSNQGSSGNATNAATKSNSSKIKYMGQEGSGVQVFDLPEDPDYSLLKRSINASANGVANIARLLVTATEEVRKIILNECDMIIECKVCHNLFRSVVNFLAHKRIYCQEEFADVRTLFHKDDVQGITSHSNTVFVEPEPPPDVHPSTSSAPDLLSKPARSAMQGMSRHTGIDSIAAKLSNRRKQRAESHDTGTASSKYYERLGLVNMTRDKLSRDCSVVLEDIGGVANARYQTFLPPSSSNSVSMNTILSEVSERSSGLTVAINEHGEIVKTAPGNVRTIDVEEPKSRSGISKDLVCNTCNTKFATQKTLSVHQRSYHGFERYIYCCPICKTSFLSMWAVIKHLQRYHKKTKHQTERLRKVIKKNVDKKMVYQNEDHNGEYCNINPLIKTQTFHDDDEIAKEELEMENQPSKMEIASPAKSSIIPSPRKCSSTKSPLKGWRSKEGVRWMCNVCHKMFITRAASLAHVATHIICNFEPKAVLVNVETGARLRNRRSICGNYGIDFFHETSDNVSDDVEELKEIVIKEKEFKSKRKNRKSVQRIAIEEPVLERAGQYTDSGSHERSSDFVFSERSENQEHFSDDEKPKCDMKFSLSYLSQAEKEKFNPVSHIKDGVKVTDSKSIIRKTLTLRKNEALDSKELGNNKREKECGPESSKVTTPVEELPSIQLATPTRVSSGNIILSEDIDEDLECLFKPSLNFVTIPYPDDRCSDVSFVKSSWEAQPEEDVHKTATQLHLFEEEWSRSTTPSESEGGKEENEPMNHLIFSKDESEDENEKFQTVLMSSEEMDVDKESAVKMEIKSESSVDDSYQANKETLLNRGLTSQTLGMRKQLSSLEDNKEKRLSSNSSASPALDLVTELKQEKSEERETNPKQEIMRTEQILVTDKDLVDKIILDGIINTEMQVKEEHLREKVNVKENFSNIDYITVKESETYKELVRDSKDNKRSDRGVTVCCESKADDNDYKNLDKQDQNTYRLLSETTKHENINISLPQEASEKIAIYQLGDIEETCSEHSQQESFSEKSVRQYKGDLEETTDAQYIPKHPGGGHNTERLVRPKCSEESIYANISAEPPAACRDLKSPIKNLSNNEIYESSPSELEKTSESSLLNQTKPATFALKPKTYSVSLTKSKSMGMSVIHSETLPPVTQSDSPLSAIQPNILSVSTSNATSPKSSAAFVSLPILPQTSEELSSDLHLPHVSTASEILTKINAHETHCLKSEASLKSLTLTNVESVVSTLEQDLPLDSVVPCTSALLSCSSTETAVVTTQSSCLSSSFTVPNAGINAHVPYQTNTSALYTQNHKIPQMQVADTKISAGLPSLACTGTLEAEPELQATILTVMHTKPINTSVTQQKVGSSALSPPKGITATNTETRITTTSQTMAGCVMTQPKIGVASVSQPKTLSGSGIQVRTLTASAQSTTAATTPIPQPKSTTACITPPKNTSLTQHRTATVYVTQPRTTTVSVTQPRTITKSVTPPRTTTTCVTQSKTITTCGTQPRTVTTIVTQPKTTTTTVTKPITSIISLSHPTNLTTSLTHPITSIISLADSRAIVSSLTHSSTNIASATQPTATITSTLQPGTTTVTVATSQSKINNVVLPRAAIASESQPTTTIESATELRNTVVSENQPITTTASLTQAKTNITSVIQARSFSAPVTQPRPVTASFQPVKITESVTQLEAKVGSATSPGTTVASTSLCKSTTTTVTQPKTNTSSASLAHQRVTDQCANKVTPSTISSTRAITTVVPATPPKTVLPPLNQAKVCTPAVIQPRSAVSVTLGKTNMEPNNQPVKMRDVEINLSHDVSDKVECRPKIPSEYPTSKILNIHGNEDEEYACFMTNKKISESRLTDLEKKDEISDKDNIIPDSQNTLLSTSSKWSEDFVATLDNCSDVSDTLKCMSVCIEHNRTGDTIVLSETSQNPDTPASNTVSSEDNAGCLKHGAEKITESFEIECKKTESSACGMENLKPKGSKRTSEGKLKLEFEGFDALNIEVKAKEKYEMLQMEVLKVVNQSVKEFGKHSTSQIQPSKSDYNLKDKFMLSESKSSYPVRSLPNVQTYRGDDPLSTKFTEKQNNQRNDHNNVESCAEAVSHLNDSHTSQCLTQEFDLNKELEMNSEKHITVESATSSKLSLNAKTISHVNSNTNESDDTSKLNAKRCLTTASAQSRFKKRVREHECVEGGYYNLKAESQLSDMNMTKKSRYIGQQIDTQQTSVCNEAFVQEFKPPDETEDNDIENKYDNATSENKLYSYFSEDEASEESVLKKMRDDWTHLPTSPQWRWRRKDKNKELWKLVMTTKATVISKKVSQTDRSGISRVDEAQKESQLPGTLENTDLKMQGEFFSGFPVQYKVTGKKMKEGYLNEKKASITNEVRDISSLDNTRRKIVPKDIELHKESISKDLPSFSRQEESQSISTVCSESLYKPSSSTQNILDLRLLETESSDHLSTTHGGTTFDEASVMHDPTTFGDLSYDYDLH